MSVEESDAKAEAALDGAMRVASTPQAKQAVLDAGLTFRAWQQWRDAKTEKGTIAMPDLTKEQREEFRRKLTEIDAVLDPLQAECDKAVKAARAPFTERLDELEAQREEVLESVDAEVRGNCEGCGVVLFFGDMGHTYRDATEIVECVKCAPTWNEEMASVDGPDDFEEPEDYEHFMAVCREHISEGRGNEKNVWEL